MPTLSPLLLTLVPSPVLDCIWMHRPISDTLPFVVVKLHEKPE